MHCPRLFACHPKCNLCFCVFPLIIATLCAWVPSVVLSVFELWIFTLHWVCPPLIWLPASELCSYFWSLPVYDCKFALYYEKNLWTDPSLLCLCLHLWSKPVLWSSWHVLGMLIFFLWRQTVCHVRYYMGLSSYGTISCNGGSSQNNVVFNVAIGTFHMLKHTHTHILCRCYIQHIHSQDLDLPPVSPLVWSGSSYISVHTVQSTVEPLCLDCFSD